MADLKGKTAFVTGASKGIGTATARALHGAGVNLGLACPEDVADTVMHVLTRPRNHRILDVPFRPVSEPSAG